MRGHELKSRQFLEFPDSISGIINSPSPYPQFLLMASSILAPSTVVLMISSSYSSVLGVSAWWSYVLSVTPVAAYIVVCLTQKNDTQVCMCETV